MPNRSPKPPLSPLAAGAKCVAETSVSAYKRVHNTAEDAEKPVAQDRFVRRDSARWHVQRDKALVLEMADVRFVRIFREMQITVVLATDHAAADKSVWAEDVLVQAVRCAARCAWICKRIVTTAVVARKNAQAVKFARMVFVSLVVR